jgi:hypothetical protein
VLFNNLARCARNAEAFLAVNEAFLARPKALGVGRASAAIENGLNNVVMSRRLRQREHVITKFDRGSFNALVPPYTLHNADAGAWFALACWVGSCGR